MKQRTFKHLTFSDRLIIEKMTSKKHKVKDIAETIGVSQQTIYNELTRGWYKGRNTDLTKKERYSPDKAEMSYQRNLAAKGPDLKIGKDHELAQYIENKIANEGYSPAAVLGEIKVKGLKFETTICETTVYSYIEKGVFLTLTNKDLPEKGKKKRSYNKVKKAARPPAGISIEKRPKEIDTRETFGHWEMDCVIGKKQTKKTLLVLTERMSRKEIIILMRDHTSQSVVRALDFLERQYGKNFNKIFKTITVDNGSEFADCKGMEKSCRKKSNRTKVYYCHPYSSYERGSNENLNKMIRRWFPKGTDFRKVTKKAILQVQEWMNNYPRGILDFKCAEDVFQQNLAYII